MQQLRMRIRWVGYASLILFCIVSHSLEAQSSSSSIAGQIRDAETGFPLEANIILARGNPSPTDVLGFHSTTTDQSGRYKFGGLQAGDQVLIVKADRYGYDRRLVTVGSRHALQNIDFELEQAVGLVGKVLNPSGGPSAGATIRVIYTAYPESDWKTVILDDELSETQTNDRGEFALGNITPGRTLVIEASSKEYPPKFSDPLATSATGDKGAILIQLEKGLSFRGLVVDEEGQTISGATVRLRDMGVGTHPFFSHSIEVQRRQFQTTTTNGDGEYRFDGVNAGPKRLRIRHADFFPSREERAISAEDVANGTVYIRSVIVSR